MSETLKEVLKDKELVLLFREFLHECNSAENLAFWLEVEEYKKSPENELQARANEIWDKYFNPKSNYELNVEGKLKSGLEQNLKNPTPNLFDGPQQAIWKVMEHDSFPKFVQTQRWKQFKGKLE